MQRILSIAACSLLPLLHPGASEAAAQVAPTAPVRGAVPDTITISLEDARRRALADNPAFLAERQETEVARGGLRHARVITFNPQLEFDAPGVATGAGWDRYEASLMQEIQWAGQRGVRMRARVGVEGAEARVRDGARQALARVMASGGWR